MWGSAGAYSASIAEEASLLPSRHVAAMATCVRPPGVWPLAASTKRGTATKSKRPRCR